MHSRTGLFLFICMVAITACDPAIGVSIANKTSAPKNIRVIYPEAFITRRDTIGNIRMDSLKAYDLAITDNYNPVIIPTQLKDTNARTYSFVLPAGHSAVVESRFLAVHPTYGQLFIIDNKDTVELKRKKSSFVKRPKIWTGGTWTYTIK
jgi:hypothetical protein